MKINITKETIGYSAHIPEYYISTQGDTTDELMINIQEALSMSDGGTSEVLKPDHFSLVY
jgi:predicted RNase H-like HicB family nuclease